MIKIDNDKLAYEREYLKLGYKYICGIDEVGRGCLFGPVTAAAVIMPLSLKDNKDIINGIEDSKKLTAKKREEFSKKIIEKSISYSIYSTKSAMINAVKNLKIKPDILFVDALKIDIDIKQISIIKGDLKSYSIGCASILAKVCRDEIMNNLPEEYQKYKISKNKGYGTKEHLEAIKKYGPSNMHRFSFEPIKSYNHKDKKNDNNKDSFIL